MRDPGRRSVPQRLPRLARHRSGHRVPARRRPRVRRPRRRRRRRRAPDPRGRPCGRSVRVRLRPVRAVPTRVSTRCAAGSSSPASPGGVRSRSTRRCPFADTNAVVVPDAVSDEAAALVGCRVSTAYRGVIERGRLARRRSAVRVRLRRRGSGRGGDGPRRRRTRGRRRHRPRCAGARRQPWAPTSRSTPATTRTSPRPCMPPPVAPTCRSIASATPPRRRTRCSACARSAGTSRSVCSLGATTEFPVSRVIRDELEVLGVHGLSASRFHEVFALMETGRLDPASMITQRLTLADVPTRAAGHGPVRQPGDHRRDRSV